MSKFSKQLVAVVPAVVLAFGAVALVAASVATGESPTLTTLPPRADTTGTVPDGLSPAVTARDWQEVEGSVVIRRSR